MGKNLEKHLEGFNSIADVIARYDAAKRQEEDFKSAEIKELRLMLAILCNKYGQLEIGDRELSYFRHNEPHFEWYYEAENRRHILRLRNETT